MEQAVMIPNTEAPNFDVNKSMFPISIVAEILKVHQRTLRIYDESGLLSPSRSSKNRRLYSFSDIEKGKFIQYLTRELGINLNGIRIIFQLLDQLGVNPKDYMQHLANVAAALEITPEIQMENRIKLSKRGRRPKQKSEE